MKKTFPLTAPPHKPPRVVERIKSEVRKYLKRERRKTLPEGADYWDFDCRSGKDEESSSQIHEKEIAASIDKAATEGWPHVYLEILAKHRTRGVPKE